MQAGDDAKRRSSPNDAQVAELLEQVGKRRISRREVLRRGVALGLTISAIGWLLAACGDDDDGTNSTATSATGAGGSTPTTAAGATGTSGTPQGGAG